MALSRGDDKAALLPLDDLTHNSVVEEAMLKSVEDDLLKLLDDSASFLL